MELVKKLKSKITKIDWFDDRFYKLEIKGEVKYFPSVTTILNVTNKPILNRWRGDVGNDVADERMNKGANRGSRIHLACANLCKGYEIHFDPSLSDLKGYNEGMLIPNQDEMLQVYKFLKWMELVNPEILEIEKIIYNEKYEYAGTLDYLIEIKKDGEYEVSGAKKLKLKKGFYVVDLKSGKNIDDDHYLQVSAYVNALKIKGLMGALIIHTNASTKSGIEGLQTYYRTNLELKNDFKSFVNAHQLWKRKFASIKPKEIEIPTKIKWSKK